MATEQILPAITPDDVPCPLGGKDALPALVRHHALVFCGLFLAAFTWGADAWYHACVAHGGGMWERLLDFTSHEAYMRLVAAVPMVLLGFAGDQLLRREASRKRELSLALSELQQVFHGTGEGMVVIDMAFRILRANEKIKEIFGIPSQEVTGRLCHEVFPCPLCHTDGCPVRKILSGEDLALCEVERAHPKGGLMTCLVTASAFRDGDGRLIGTIESYADITHRKKMEEELRRHRDRLEAMVEERTAALSRANKTLREEVARRRLVQAELEKANRELKEHQAQLVQSEKMASIGQLAAGVAHEINNPTGFIRSNLSTLLDYQADLKEFAARCSALQEVAAGRARETGDPELEEAAGAVAEAASRMDLEFILDDMAEAIGQCIEGADRIRAIVSDLKDFSHVDRPELEEADLNHGLKSTLNIAWNEIKYRAEVETDLGEIPLVRCYPQQLNQVFLNLLVNAAQAMEEKGVIRIGTRCLSENGKRLVAVEISDTGKGIPSEVLPRIFDPFFTTKEVGKGTGLGLHIAYKIVERHGGSILVESEEGRGTTFRVLLPVAGPRDQSP